MNKIVSNFYLIKVGGKPSYVGYTNRPIKTRFKEHLRDKDFGDEPVELEILGSLAYDFTWDMELINQYAKEVSDRETELIVQYVTQDSIWQKGVNGNIGGQTWANVKNFVRTNRDNPKFMNMNESDIIKYLETIDKVSRYMKSFVGNMDDPISTYIKSFVSHMDNPVSLYLKDFVHHIDDQVFIYIGNFVHHMEDPVDSYMKNFVSNMDNTISTYLKNFVNHMDEPVAIYMRSFVSHMDNQVGVYMRSFVNTMNDPVAIYIKNFVTGMKKSIDN